MLSRFPFPDNEFQIVTCGVLACGNVTDTDRCLAEMVRVLQPGGKVAILEFSKPSGSIFGKLYRCYFRYLLPLVGQAISRSKDNALSVVISPASVQEFDSGRSAGPDGWKSMAWVRCAGIRSPLASPRCMWESSRQACLPIQQRRAHDDPMASVVRGPVDEDSVPLHLLEPKATEKALLAARLIVDKPSLWELYNMLVGSTHPQVLKEIFGHGTSFDKRTANSPGSLCWHTRLG